MDGCPLVKGGGERKRAGDLQFATRTRTPPRACGASAPLSKGADAPQARGGVLVRVANCKPPARLRSLPPLTRGHPSIGLPKTMGIRFNALPVAPAGNS